MRFHLPALDMSFGAVSPRRPGCLYKDGSSLSLTDRFLAAATNLPTAPTKQMSRYDSKKESPAHHPIAPLPAAASVLSLISGFNPITSVAGVPAATQADPSGHNRPGGQWSWGGY
jgi:hypothetical protein